MIGRSSPRTSLSNSESSFFVGNLLAKSSESVLTKKWFFDILNDVRSSYYDLQEATATMF